MTTQTTAVTREDLLNAKGYQYDALVSYADMLRSNVGVEIGDTMPPEIVGEAPTDFINAVFTADDRVIEVEEFELYLAARFEGETEVTYFALDELDDEE